MVNKNYILTVVGFMQLLAVMGVCFNHWSITLLKGSTPFFSAAAYREGAMFGLMFLFFSSGVMSQLVFSDLSIWGERKARIDFVIGRYIRLVTPVIIAVAIDYWLQGFADHIQTKDVLRATPFILTLTQTWHYSILGATSLAEPAGGSNMAWLGADLFFLSVFFGVTTRIWNKIKSAKILCFILAISVVVLAAYLNIINYKAQEIDMWAANRYGANLHADFGLRQWLFEYSPFVNIPAFLAGILLARILRLENGRLLGGVFVIAAIFALVCPGDAAYLGWSIAITILVVRWIQTSITEESKAARLLDSAGIVARLGSSAYEVYVLHLIIYSAFTLAATPAMSAYGIVLLIGRLLAVNFLMLVLCLGFAELYSARWLGRLMTSLGFNRSELLRYV